MAGFGSDDKLGRGAGQTLGTAGGLVAAQAWRDSLVSQVRGEGRADQAPREPEKARRSRNRAMPRAAWRAALRPRAQRP